MLWGYSMNKEALENTMEEQTRLLCTELIGAFLKVLIVLIGFQDEYLYLQKHKTPVAA